MRVIVLYPPVAPAIHPDPRWLEVAASWRAAGHEVVPIDANAIFWDERLRAGIDDGTIQRLRSRFRSLEQRLRLSADESRTYAHLAGIVPLLDAVGARLSDALAGVRSVGAYLVPDSVPPGNPPPAPPIAAHRAVLDLAATAIRDALPLGRWAGRTRDELTRMEATEHCSPIDACWLSIVSAFDAAVDVVVPAVSFDSQLGPLVRLERILAGRSNAPRILWRPATDTMSIPAASHRPQRVEPGRAPLECLGIGGESLRVDAPGPRARGLGLLLSAFPAVPASGGGTLSLAHALREAGARASAVGSGAPSPWTVALSAGEVCMRSDLLRLRASGVVGVETRLDARTLASESSAPGERLAALARTASDIGIPLRITSGDDLEETSVPAAARLLSELSEALAGQFGVEVRPLPAGVGSPAATPRARAVARPLSPLPPLVPIVAREGLPSPEAMPPRPLILFEDAIQIVAASGHDRFAAFTGPRDRRPDPAPGSPAAWVPGLDPDVVLIRLAHDPDRRPDEGGVGRTAGEQIAGGLARRQDTVHAVHLGTRRRHRLSSSAARILLAMDGKRSVQEIAAEVAGEGVHPLLVERAAALVGDLAEAGLVARGAVSGP